MSDRDSHIDDDEARQFLADKIHELTGGRDWIDLVHQLLPSVQETAPFDSDTRAKIAHALRPRPRKWRPTQEAIDKFIDQVEPQTQRFAASFERCTWGENGHVKLDQVRLAGIALRLEEIYRLAAGLGETGKACLAEVHSWGISEMKKQPESPDRALWSGALDPVMDAMIAPTSFVLSRTRALFLLALELMPPTPGTRGNSRFGFCTRKWLGILARVHRKAFLEAFGQEPTTTEDGPGSESFRELAKLITGYYGFKARGYILRARSRQ